MTDESRQRGANSDRTQDSYIYRGSKTSVEHFVTRTAGREASFFLPHLRSSMRLLDCGCGPGTITTGLADIIAPGEVVGFDNGPEQVELARSHAAANNISNVTFQVASIYEIPFPNESFDAVFSHNVLEHLEEPMDALKEAHRVLKPGGVIGVRDLEADGMVISPLTPILKESVEVVVKVWESLSGSPRMGKTLRSLLQQTGFIDVQATGS